MADDIGNFLSSLAGKRIPGGCPTCNAEQMVTERSPGVWVLTVAHDAQCTVLRASKAVTN